MASKASHLVAHRLLFWGQQYATCTSPIMHLICPPKFCITFVFNFPWVLQLSQRKIKNNAYVKYGALWEMCKWRIANISIGIFQMHCYCCSIDQTLETIIPLNSEWFSLVNTRLKLRFAMLENSIKIYLCVCTVYRHIWHLHISHNAPLFFPSNFA